MTEQQGTGGFGPGGDQIAPGPLTPTGEQPARPSGPPATGSPAQNPEPAANPWGGWGGQPQGGTATTAGQSTQPVQEVAAPVAPRGFGSSYGQSSTPQPSQNPGHGSAGYGSAGYGSAGPGQSHQAQPAANPWPSQSTGPAAAQAAVPQSQPAPQQPAPQPSAAPSATSHPSATNPQTSAAAPQTSASQPAGFGSSYGSQSSESQSYGSQSYGSQAYGSQASAGGFGSTAGSANSAFGASAFGAATQAPATTSGFSGHTGQPQPSGIVPQNPSNPTQPPAQQKEVSRRGLLGMAVGAGAVTGAVVGGGVSLGAWLLTRPEEPEEILDPPPIEVLDAAAVAAKVLPSTVMLIVPQGNSTGSGFVMDGEGRIMTNNHVVDAAIEQGGRITVLFNDGTRGYATPIGSSPSYDIAVIQLSSPKAEAPPVELANSDEVSVGDTAVALGAPLGLAATVTQGIISARNRPVAVGKTTADASFINALQTDAPINPGNSGGPLSDDTGRIIGVNSAILSNATGDQTPGSIGIGFAIPINQAKAVAEEIIATKKATFPVTGAEVENAGNNEGAKIVSVDGGSPAAEAGLQVDDVVVGIDGRSVSTMVEFFVAVRSHRPGDQVVFTYNRNSTLGETTVTLGSEEG